MLCQCTLGAYSCTPKSHIPASGCGPHTIPDLHDHPISHTTAPEELNHQSLALGQKEAKEPLINNNNHSSVTSTLTVVVNPTDGTGNQEIHQPTHTEQHTQHNTNATHQINPTCIDYRYHPTCHQQMMQETKGRQDNQQVMNPPQLMEAQGLEQPALLPAAQAMTDKK